METLRKMISDAHAKIESLFTSVKKLEQQDIAELKARIEALEAKAAPEVAAPVKPAPAAKA